MKNSKMIHLFKGKKHLTVLEVEKEFSNVKPGKLFEKHDLFIDLSQLIFAQLSAINYLALQIERQSKSNRIKTLFVAYPLRHYTRGEENSSNVNFSPEMKVTLLKGRVRVNSFLKNTKFASAIRDGVKPYNVLVYFTEKFNFEAEFNIENFESAFEEINDIEANGQSGYNYIYPLEWISISDIKINYESIEERFNQVLENSDRGLESLDVNAIKNVVFSELSKNVIEHSEGKDEEKRFLLSIGLLSTTSLKEDKYHLPNEKEFIDWVHEEEIPSLVEIYFGDTGGGFFSEDFIKKCKHEKIEKKDEQLKWAFQRWTTKKFEQERRGTKGLYRINRIVNNYNGIFHIITNDQNGGYRKGGLKNERWIHRKCESNFEGTFIQIKLCPYSIVKEFKFTLREDQKNRKWKTLNIDVTRDSTLLLEEIEEEFKSEINILAILDLEKNVALDDAAKMVMLNNILLEISYHAHPTGAVVYINSKLKKDSLDIVINSINEYIKNKTSTEIEEDKDNEDIYDTVIVIYEKNTFWYGGNQNIINILNEVYENNFNKKIDELISYQSLEPQDKVKIRQSLENDNKLIHVKNSGEIELDFTSLDSHFGKIIQNKIEEEKSKSKEKFLSPKLQILDYWLDVTKLLENNEFGFALTLYLKTLEYIKQNVKIDKHNQLYILIDHRQHILLAIALLSLFGLSANHLINIQDEVQNNSLRRFKLIPEKSNVIVLTSIISSSETIRRLVKFVKRDNANPMLILCLSNNRKNNINKLETWESTTEIKSIYAEFEVEQPKINRNNEYFNIKAQELKRHSYSLRQPNYERVEWADYKLVQPDLISHLNKSKSLNYNHIGIKNDRHFTFYVDKYKLLNSNSIIWTSIVENIEKWKIANSINEFTIYVKDDFLYNGKSRFMEHLTATYPNVKIYNELPKIEIDDAIIGMINKEDLNVFIIDFGLISGDTINSMLSKFKGLNNLFICIIFNQSNSNKFDYYRRLTGLSNPFQPKSPHTNLKIEFLLDLPLNYYNRENCPICNHIDALEYYKMSDREDDYMFVFSEDRQKRLTIREKGEVLKEEYPFDFYYQFPDSRDQELSSEIISKMFYLKLFLEDSLENTKSRSDLFVYIYDIYLRKEEYLKNTDSELYALIYYLSYEVHWLQREPLIFRDFREMLSNISNYICNMDINKLVEIFKDDKRYNINPLAGATRYKYSAISLLRSANKLEFCSNVGNIVATSNENNRYSNNLLQNAFYHTFSIYKNKYNKSRKYFIRLLESYKQINNIDELTDEQKFTSNKIFHLLSSKLIEFDIDILDDLGLIRELKAENHKNYKTQSHPPFQKRMGNIMLNQFSAKGIEDIRANGPTSVYYDTFVRFTQNLFQDWQSVRLYLSTSIQPYYKKLSVIFKNSFTFKDDYILYKFFERVFDDTTVNVIDRFSRLVSQISSNPLEYLTYKDEYDKIHSSLFELILKEDSIFNKLLDQFPTNINSILKEKLSPLFPKLTIHSERDFLVFYPKYRFQNDLASIIDNITTRINENLKDISFVELGIMSNIDVVVNILEESEFIKIQISYNGTEEKNISHPHLNDKKGGLEIMAIEVNNFGGSVVYNKTTVENGIFCITVKLRKYE